MNMKQLLLLISVFVTGYFAATLNLEVEGFTKLGSNAPPIKMISTTGTFADTVRSNDEFFISHGLNASKIVSVDVLVENQWDGMGFTHDNLNRFNYLILPNDIYVVFDLVGAQGYLLNLGYKITIMYEE